VAGLLTADPEEESSDDSEVGDGNNGGGGSSSGGGDNGVLCNLSCEASVAQGKYANAQSVNISCTNSSAEIKFCLIPKVDDSSTCDPISGDDFSDPVTVGSSDGKFILSFVGTAECTSSKVSREYNILSTAPNQSTVSSAAQFQTTQFPQELTVSSTDFALEHDQYVLSVYNFKGTDPRVSLDPDNECTPIKDAETIPISITEEFNLQGFDSGDDVAITLNATALEVGDNFITTIVEDKSTTDRRISCSTQKIILTDFAHFGVSSAGGTSVDGDGVRNFGGSFSAYSMFKADPVNSPINRGVGTFDDSTSNSQIQHDKSLFFH
jgi:hypothetical protein